MNIEGFKMELYCLYDAPKQAVLIILDKTDVSEEVILLDSSSDSFSVGGEDFLTQYQKI